MKTSPNDVSNQEILEALNSFASAVDVRFDRLEGRMDSLEVRMERLEGRMDKMENRQNRAEVTMVTKDYLDQKLADLRFAPVLSSIQKR